MFRKELLTRIPSLSNSKTRMMTTLQRLTPTKTSFNNIKENLELPNRLWDFSLNHHSKIMSIKGEDSEYTYIKSTLKIIIVAFTSSSSSSVSSSFRITKRHLRAKSIVAESP